MSNTTENSNLLPGNFITDIIDKDLKDGKNNGEVITRFPPEPNGYLHLGHAKSICLNYGIAEKYNGQFNLRFDDTNPTKEEQEYVDSIIKDVKWLGADFGENLFFASDYFDQMHEYAVEMVKQGKAYVDSLSADEIREKRGTLTSPGENSPYRDRTIEENLDLFEKMRKGEFKEGECVLRAKIDMTSPNINLRDPIMYRIQHASHHRTGDKWCIYPMYDWAHGLEDSIEKVTHSICTVEFEDHRPLYNWFLEQLPIERKPQQIEFARLNLTNTLMSKRKLKDLVDTGIVDGWDDPRMPTISGIRRRGYTPLAIKRFANAIGVAKAHSVVDLKNLEFFVREDLDANAERRMAVLDPLKVVITNYPEGQVEWMDAKNHPKKPEMELRKMPFTRELYIEKEDFQEEPAKKFFRLAPGREVRLQHGYYVTCTDVIKDENGEIKELHCTYDPATRGGWYPERKVKGTLHWVSAEYAKEAEIRMYDKLFTKENPEQVEEGEDYKVNLNPESLKTVKALVEPELAKAPAEERFQFLRHGYFCADKSTSEENPVFNLTVTLKESKNK
jgi:glutaminyl-tRNA synthetase